MVLGEVEIQCHVFVCKPDAMKRVTMDSAAEWFQISWDILLDSFIFHLNRVLPTLYQIPMNNLDNVQNMKWIFELLANL